MKGRTVYVGSWRVNCFSSSSFLSQKMQHAVHTSLPREPLDYHKNVRRVKQTKCRVKPVYTVEESWGASENGQGSATLLFLRGGSICSPTSSLLRVWVQTDLGLRSAPIQGGSINI